MTRHSTRRATGMLLRLTPYQTERQKNVELMKKALKEK